MTQEIADEPLQWPVLDSVSRFSGAVISVRSDTVLSPVDGSQFVRDVVTHLGAVAVVAVDEHDQVLVVRQYRHPVGLRPVELPAGLRDVDGEPPHRTAVRELREEGHVTAQRWHALVDILTSPGTMTEAVRVFLARDITPIPAAERFSGPHEEADMSAEWVPMSQLVDAILAGRVQNGLLVSGVLAAWAVRIGGDESALRDPDAAWPSGGRA